MKKDSGYCWLILLSSFSSIALCLGVPLTFGTYFPVLAAEFRHHGTGEVAAIGSISYGVSHMASPFASFLYRKFGCRFVVIAGGLVASCGLFMTYFARRLWDLYITYGVVCGLGYGMIYAPSLAIIPVYFDKYRYFALSFATVGGAVGALAAPPLCLLLIERYTWRGSLLIVSGLISNVIVFGMLMKSSSSSRGGDKKTGGNQLSSVVKINTAKSVWSTERRLLKDFRFYVACLESYCFGTCSYTMFSLINVLIVDNGRLSMDTSVALVTLVGFSNVFGRVGASVLTHGHRTKRSAFFASVSFLCTAALLALPYCHSFTTFALTLALYGCSYGARISQVSGVLIETFGVEDMPSAIGYYLCAGGAGALTGPPIAGKIADLTSSLPNAFFYAAGYNFLDFLLCLFLVFCSWYKIRRYNLVSNSIVEPII